MHNIPLVCLCMAILDVLWLHKVGSFQTSFLKSCPDLPPQTHPHDILEFYRARKSSAECQYNLVCHKQ